LEPVDEREDDEGTIEREVDDNEDDLNIPAAVEVIAEDEDGRFELLEDEIIVDDNVDENLLEETAEGEEEADDDCGREELDMAVEERAELDGAAEDEREEEDKADT
jgi:hypothetical protein